MALHLDFPQSPYKTLIPGHRWFATPKRNPDSLDTPLPKPSRRDVRQFKNLSALDPSAFGNKRLPLKSFTEEETREMIFKKILDSEIDHTLRLDDVKADGDLSTYTPDFIVRDTLTELAAEQHSQIIAASHSSTVMQVAGEKDVLVAFLGAPHRVDTRARQNQVKKALESIPLSDFYLAQQAGWMFYLEGTTDLAILRKLALRKNHAAAAILAGRVPLVCLGSNKPGDARSHYEAMREAMPGIPGLAIFDRLPNPDTQLSTMSGLREEMWKRREIENYLVTRESLLAYVTSGLDTDDLFSTAERERRIKIMTDCIAELENALAVTRKPSPWSEDIKVTDDFLDPLFVNYYQQLGTPQLTYTRDYHGLAETIPLDQLEPEIDAMLDAVVSIVGQAVPA